MKQKRLILMLGMAAMLASCGQDELGGAQTDGAVTITATVDNGMGTRASTYGTDDVAVCIDKLQYGMGCVNSWGALPLPEYCIPYADYTFRVKIAPQRML